MALSILETAAGVPVLSATFKGERQALTTAALAGTFLRLPFLTAKIFAAIHWEALKLYLKGARYHLRPPPPPRASFGDVGPQQAAAPPELRPVR